MVLKKLAFVKCRCLLYMFLHIKTFHTHTRIINQDKLVYHMTEEKVIRSLLVFIL